VAAKKKNGDNPNNMLVEYKPGTTFPGAIGRTVGESSPAWPAPLRAKEGAPIEERFVRGAIKCTRLHRNQR